MCADECNVMFAYIIVLGATGGVHWLCVVNCLLIVAQRGGGVGGGGGGNIVL